jgi:hypothetical protein
MFLSNLTELTMSQGYRRFFRVVPALTDALRAENYRIRHEVYCRDLGFEPLRPDGLEADDFDERSVHCLVQSVSTGSTSAAHAWSWSIRQPQAAAVRESPARPRLTGRRSTRWHSTGRGSPRSRVWRWSAATAAGKVSKTGRSRFRTRISAPKRRPRQPYLALAVYLGLISLARHYGISTLLGADRTATGHEPSRLGVRFERIGGDVHHRGTCAFPR